MTHDIGIMTTLREAGTAMTVREIADAMNASPNGVRKAVHTLARYGMVRQAGMHPFGDKGGRPAKLWEVTE